MCKYNFELPFDFAKGLLICTILMFIVVNSLEYKDVLDASVFIYGIFSLFWIYKSKAESFGSKVISVAFLIFTYIMLYYLSALKNYDVSIVLKLFFFPLFWLIVTFIGNYFSKKKNFKNLQFINFKMPGSTKEKITTLDIWYSVFGYISVIIWIAVINKS